MDCSGSAWAVAFSGSAGAVAFSGSAWAAAFSGSAGAVAFSGSASAVVFSGSAWATAFSSSVSDAFSLESFCSESWSLALASRYVLLLLLLLLHLEVFLLGERYVNVCYLFLFLIDCPTRNLLNFLCHELSISVLNFLQCSFFF